MKASINKMIKQTLLDGLRRSRYNLSKTKLKYPKGGWGISRQDRDRAYKWAYSTLESMRSLRLEGDESLPSTPEGIERYIEVRIAKQSFDFAYALINNPVFGRSNRELVREAREAIETLRSLGGEQADTASTYERMLDRKIGAE